VGDDRGVLGMPSDTPVTIIHEENALFGTVRIEQSGDTCQYKKNQLPSLYFMNDTGEFVRLRPLHEHGFMVIVRPSRTMFMMAGDTRLPSLQIPLSDAKASIQAMVARATKNECPFIRYDDDPDSGTYGSFRFEEGTGFEYAWIRDYTDPMDSTKRPHTGHALISWEGVRRFYARNAPGFVFGNLMNLGKIKVQAVLGGQPAVIQTDTRYLELGSMAEDAHFTAVLKFIESFAVA